MTKIQKPTLKYKLNNASKVISVTERENMLKSKEEGSEDEIAKIQESIDDYNFNVCPNVDEWFDTITLTNNDIIVRLHKENYIKSIQETGFGCVYESWITPVDMRGGKGTEAKWEDNPLPYVNSGVVCAISPNAEAELARKQEEAAKYGIIYDRLKVGDIVNLAKLSAADYRYYRNKQVQDYFKTVDDFRLNNFEGYVKLNYNMLESIVRDKNNFYSNLSIYKNYKDEKVRNNGAISL